MKTYAEATDSTFGPSYHVDVFINMIKDKEMSMNLRGRSPKSLEEAVEFAAKWIQDKKNVENVCASPLQQPTFRQFREPEAEPMEVDQLRFKPRRFDTRRPQRQDRHTSQASPRSANASAPVVCFACNEPGHAGNSCPELLRCKDIIAKYKKKLDKRNGNFERSFRPPSRDSKERKFHRVTRLVQELGLQDDDEQASDSSGFLDVDEEEESTQQTETTTERTEPAVQDF